MLILWGSLTSNYMVTVVCSEMVDSIKRFKSQLPVC